jgi:uncharacterized protein DUF6916
MTSSRREFLKRGTWMALAAGIPLSLTQRVPGMELTESPARSALSKAAFESQLNTKFLINHATSKVVAELVAVTDIGSRKQRKAGKEGFSLVFRAGTESILLQNTYLIEHQALGMFSFLLVPVGRKTSRTQHYEAVVNRLYP